jgi:penicillin-binding protein 1A
MTRYLKIPLVIVVALAAFTVAGAAILVGAYYYLAPGLPSAEELRNIRIQVPLQIYSRDGRLISEFGEQKRTPVAYDDIPPLIIKAVLAAEDEHFFEHPGIDWRGIVRGFLSEIGAFSGQSGGSTITQQVTRTSNLFPRAGTRSGFTRFVQKFREWILAFRIEHEFTKQEILSLYLNTYYYGQRSYGIVTAARTYFGKELRDLTVSEVAILAGITARPEDLNPVASPERATARRAYVLRRMRETEAIDDAQYKTALAEPVVAKKFDNENQLDAPYVAEMVRAEMIRRFGPAAYTAGLKVTTTIDSRLQRAANRAIRETLTAYDERHGFRGPVAHVDLDGDTSRGGVAGTDHTTLEGVLDDHPPPLADLESAIVLAVEPESARVYFKSSGEETIPFGAVEWAAPYIDDDSKGARPTTVPQVLHAGDIVLFRRDADGNRRLAELPEVQGAFASVDPQDGAVVALTGGFDFFLSNYNRAVQTNRQPGSSFKPFIYSAALANGFNTASIINDAPIDLGYQPELERVWKPANFNNEYFGEVTLRFALQKSLNSVSVKLVQAIGVPDAVRYVKRFGFDDVAAPNNLSIALGSGGVAPIELAGAYATFANGGFRVEPYFIDRITDANGDTLFEAEPAFVCADCEAQGMAIPGTVAPPPTGHDSKQASAELINDVTELYPPLRAAPRIITAQNAYLMTDLLQEVVRSGSGVEARRQLGRSDMAGKTGTTNDGKDTWFVGFNSDIVGAAWVGFDEERPLGPSEQGGYTAIPMWIGFMREAFAGMPLHTMARPPGIIEYRINPRNGKIASDATRDTVFEKFEIGHVPEREPDPEFNVSGPVGPATNTGNTVRDLFQ